MADNNIVYKISVDSESGTATIRDLKGQIVATQVPVNKLKENFNDLTVSINKNKNATDGNVVAHKNSELTLNAEISKLNSLRSALDISSKEYVEMGNTIDLLNQKKASLKRGTEGLVNANGMLKNSSGAATSATMELGRVISDAPYGIRGMANNITQLVSQLGFATTAAGSFKAAMRQMWTALMGPLGIVLAITTVVSLFDGFFGAQKKVEKSTRDLKSEFEGLAKVLRDDVGASIEGYIELMKEKAIIDAEIADSSQRVSDIEEELIQISKDRTYWEGIKATQLELTGEVQERTLRRLNPLIDREKELIEERNSIYKDSADKINKFKQKRDEQNKASIKTVKGLKQEISLLQKERDKLSESSEQWQKYTLKITNAEQAIKKIKGELDKNVKEPLVFGSVDWYNDAISSLEKFRDANLKVGSKAFKDETKIIERLKKELEAATGVDGGKTKLLEIEDFDETAKTYENELSKLNEKLELLDAKSEAEKLEIKKKYHLARLDAQHTEHIEKYEQTAAEYKADLKLYLDQQVLLDKMSQEDANKRLAIFDSNTKTQIKQSNDSFEILRSITKKSYDNRILDALFAGQKLAGDGKTQAQKDLIDTHRHLKHKAELYASYADTVKQVLGSIGDFIGAEFERELVTEENRNNEANKILNDRLLNENLSKDQRADIQNQIAQNDEKLRVKKEKIARKQFNVEKAFKIGMALADTASSALKAYGSQIIIGDPTSIVRAAAAAKVATAFGLANVAMIARSKFQTAAPSKPANASIGSTDGETSERAEPSFNIVGRSNENLLINAIQAQFGKPLKAYVVSRDVTTQQQLDGMIVGQAGT